MKKLPSVSPELSKSLVRRSYKTPALYMWDKSQNYGKKKREIMKIYVNLRNAEYSQF